MSDTSNTLTLQSELLDTMILNSYLNLLNEQDPRVRLAATDRLAEIRGHLGRSKNTPPSPTQINTFISTPEQLSGIIGGMRQLVGARSD